MATRSWSRSITGKPAAGSHYSDVGVRKMMWRYDVEGDHENNDAESVTITAEKHPLLINSSAVQ